MSPRLAARKVDWQERKEFLQTVWYESGRAGIGPGLVLALVETTSNFHKFYVRKDGARGYMGVAPAWSRAIGDGDAGKLFHAQTNLRFGCVVLRHFLEQSGGNVRLALEGYYASNAGDNPDTAAARLFSERVRANAQHWGGVEVALR